jgi:hypothetical protein
MDKPMSARVELRLLLEGMSRRSILSSRTRLFCAECQRVMAVVDVFSGGLCLLECKHRREIEEGVKARIAKLEHEVERETKREEVA